MNLALSTDPLPPPERFPYWRDAMLNHFGLQAQCEPHHELSFQASLTQYAIGQTILREMSGTPHSVERKRASADHRFIVQFQLKGWCEIRQGGEEIRLDPGQMVLYRNSLPIHIKRDGCFRNLLFSIAENRFLSSFPQWRHVPAMQIAAEVGTPAVFADMLHSLLRQAKKMDSASLEGVAESAINLLGAALQPLADNQPRDQSHLEMYHKSRIKKFIASNMHNPDIDVQTIAEAVGLSRRYIHQLFSNEPQHLMQWVLVQRLEHCRRELGSDHTRHRTISEIAFSWGFNDLAHFSKAFRKHFGIPPNEVHGKKCPHQSAHLDNK